MLKIYELPEQKRVQALYEYNTLKRSKTNGYLCRFFGRYRIYTGQYGLFILYLLSMLVYVGILRRLFDGFRVSEFVDKKNKEIDEMLYHKYL